MRKQLDKIPLNVTKEELIISINKTIDALNSMLAEIDEDNLSQNIIEILKGGKK